MLKYAALSKFKLTSRILCSCQCAKKKVSFCCAYLKWMEEPEFWFCGLNLYFFPGDKLFVTLKSNSLLDAFLERNPTANFPTDHYYHRELTKSVPLFFIYMYICTGHFLDVFTYLFMKLCLKIFRENKLLFFGFFFKYYAMKMIHKFYICFAITCTSVHIQINKNIEWTMQCADGSHTCGFIHTLRFDWCPEKCHSRVVLLIFWNNHKMAILLILMDYLSNKVC